MADSGERQPPPDDMTSDVDILRRVVTSLQRCMKTLGLVPSRVYVFMKAPQTGPEQQQGKYPSPRMFARVTRQEGEDMDMAVLSFIDMLLDENAPPFALTSFLQALLDANNDLRTPNANPALYLVHDVIKLACAYLPLQQNLMTFLAEGEGEGRAMNFQAVVNQLTDQGLLKPEHVPHVVEALDEDRPQAAAERMLTFAYVARVENMNNFLEEQRQMPGRDQLQEPGDVGDAARQMQWLQVLVDSVERNGGAGFSDTLPPSVLSVDTWEAVYGQLALGGRWPALRDDDLDDLDSRSEAGESVASDATMVSEGRNNDDDDAAIVTNEDDDADRLNVNRNHLVISINNLKNKFSDVDLNRDQESRTRHQRTREYVMDHGGAQITRVMEIYNHFYEVLPAAEIEAAAANNLPAMDDDETRSMSSFMSRSSNSSSGTTDNNLSLVLSGNNLSGHNNLVLNYLRGTRQSRNAALADGQIHLRQYQEELLRLVREGKNSAIFLPTGTGKTFIILKYVQEHFSRPGLNRVMFLAPKVKLAEQQYHRFRDFFPKDTYFRCGRSRSSTASFAELLDTFKVFVLTPQCLVEAIEKKEVKMTDFSILVLDECHHLGHGKHAYKVLMDLYMDAKFEQSSTQPGALLPQVIGLTASPGVGGGGTLLSAVTYINELCYSMDVEAICTVRENTEELEEFVNEPNHEIHTCKKRKKDGFKKIVEELMKSIEYGMTSGPFTDRHWTQELEDRLTTILIAPELHRGSLQYYQWLTGIENRLMNFVEFKVTYQKVFTMMQMLVVYQKCLMLNEDCQSQYALEFLQEQARILEDQVPRDQPACTERQLLDHFYRRMPDLQRACDDPEDFNPKLAMLEDILLAISEENQNCACMVFVRTLELTKALQRWVEEHPQLSRLKPGRLTGHHRSGGMTQKELSDVMKKFNRGDHNLVVCTSAAEEGLDFQACNIVVRYDYVTSMISMIQTRGRARRADSQYCVVGTLTEGNVNKERENVAAERLMKQAVEKVQADMEASANNYLHLMRQSQKRGYEQRKCAAAFALEKRKVRVTNTTPYRLLCRKCQEPACMSTDFRLLEQSNWAVISKDFKWKRVQTKEPVQYKQNIEKVAKAHCHKCSFDWGVEIRHIPTNLLLPVLKISSFFLEDTLTHEKMLKKYRWSEVPFEVPEMSHEDLSRLL